MEFAFQLNRASHVLWLLKAKQNSDDGLYSLLLHATWEGVRLIVNVLNCIFIMAL